MSELILSILHGLYWPLFLAAVLGVFLRLRERKWSSFDSLTASAFLLFILLTASLPRLFYGPMASHAPRRYLFVFLPLCLPFAAHGFLRLRYGLRNRFSFLLLILLLTHLGLFLYGTYLPPVLERTSRSKREHRFLCLTAAEWIRRDWADREAKKVYPIRYDHYQSGKRPLVESPLPRIGFLSGGQDFSPFLREKGIRPDYVIRIPGETEDIPEDYAIRLETPGGTGLFIVRCGDDSPAP